MTYTLFGPDPSGFTRKLEAALIFYQAPFDRVIAIGEERETLKQRAGTHQLPVMRTPENWVLADTTPIMQLLDGRYPRRRMFGEGANGFFVHLLEEVLDEWVSRVYVHYRWHYSQNTRFALERLGGEIVADPAIMADWGLRSCRATGTESTEQRRAAETEYLALLTAAEAQLERTTWLLGERPSAVDAALLGGLRAHTHHDPYPDLSIFPNVVAYAEGARDDWDGGGTLEPFPVNEPFADHLVRLAREYCVPFADSNRTARLEGRKAFELMVYGEPVSFLARAYPEASRQMIAARYRDQLSAAEQQQVCDWLVRENLESVIR